MLNETRSSDIHSHQQLRVLLDAHMVGSHESGNETYIANLLLQNSAFFARGIQLYALLSNSEQGRDFIDTQYAYIDPTADRNLYRFFRSIPKAIQGTKANLLHVTYHAPFWIRTPYVVTIHDTSYRTHPQYQSVRNVIVQNLLGYLTIMRARLVITASQYVKSEIERIYPGVVGRVFVTPYAASDKWKPQASADLQKVRSNLGIRQRFFLSVCRFQPRKNLDSVIKAFINSRSGDNGFQLVLAGEYATKTGQQIARKYMDLIGRRILILPGHCSEHELACLYTGCEAFVFPSLYEGFGLPILEAMQCGAPVITSVTTALPEVAGDAALTVDPTNTDAITAALLAISNNAGLAHELTRKGYGQAKRFSWELTTLRTAELYHQAANAPNR